MEVPLPQRRLAHPAQPRALPFSPLPLFKCRHGVQQGCASLSEQAEHDDVIDVVCSVRLCMYLPHVPERGVVKYHAPGMYTQRKVQMRLQDIITYVRTLQNAVVCERPHKCRCLALFGVGAVVLAPPVSKGAHTCQA